MNNFLSSLQQNLDNKNATPNMTNSDYPVLAEVDISGTQLHKIATGECCMLTDGSLGIRFLLKNSFKSKYRNYVVNNFAMQIVAIGKNNAMSREDIAVKTKVKTVQKEVPKKIVKKAEPVKKAVLNKEEVI